MENIALSAQRIDKWVQDLVDLAKLRAGEYQLKLDLVDSSPPLRRAAAAARASIDAKGQSLILEIVEPLPRARIDEHRLEQVVIELLAVASKHAPAWGEIVLLAREEDCHLLVEVQDSAPSIHREVPVLSCIS